MRRNSFNVLNKFALLAGTAGLALTLALGGPSSSEDWYAGLRYGGGLEVPLDDSVALRFDYTFTDYGTLSLLAGDKLETYNTRESLFRLGATLKL